MSLDAKIPTADCFVGFIVVKAIQKDKMLQHRTSPLTLKLPLSPCGQLTFTLLSVQAAGGLRQHMLPLHRLSSIFPMLEEYVCFWLSCNSSDSTSSSAFTHFSHLDVFPSPPFSTRSSSVHLDFLHYLVLSWPFHRSLNWKYFVAFHSKLLYSVFLTWKFLSTLNCIVTVTK